MAKSIAVAGKGGTGKTTIAALLVTQLGLRGWGPVLAIDADPDSNLGNLLGIKSLQSIGDLREDALKAIKQLPAGMTKANYVEAGLHQIIEEAEGFDLLTMGRGEGAGCYCALNNMIRKFSDDLTPSYKWVIMDNEAGLEHLSRRTTRDIDALVVVVTDNPLSIASAERIQADHRDPGQPDRQEVHRDQRRQGGAQGGGAGKGAGFPPGVPGGHPVRPPAGRDDFSRRTFEKT